eukprot:CAMPEP_0115009576 /NCGR_PEP_ID=MMETSP0216-20121206/22718_1 /TAXON_ID=223996 /ORGANISM="Protocruzia adherens, Strain Boccale" /LENGTH=709 /DNA_ID=CAMNT_0002377457 /DNA_START=143 /DNA_END=2272 /DNA_ORIENTATION=-
MGIEGGYNPNQLSPQWSENGFQQRRAALQNMIHRMETPRSDTVAIGASDEVGSLESDSDLSEAYSESSPRVKSLAMHRDYLLRANVKGKAQGSRNKHSRSRQKVNMPMLGRVSSMDNKIIAKGSFIDNLNTSQMEEFDDRKSRKSGRGTSSSSAKNRGIRNSANRRSTKSLKSSKKSENHESLSTRATLEDNIEALEEDILEENEIEDSEVMETVQRQTSIEAREVSPSTKDRIVDAIKQRFMKKHIKPKIQLEEVAEVADGEETGRQTSKRNSGYFQRKETSLGTFMTKKTLTTSERKATLADDKVTEVDEKSDDEGKTQKIEKKGTKSSPEGEAMKSLHIRPKIADPVDDSVVLPSMTSISRLEHPDAREARSSRRDQSFASFLLTYEDTKKLLDRRYQKIKKAQAKVKASPLTRFRAAVWAVLFTDELQLVAEAHMRKKRIQTIRQHHNGIETIYQSLKLWVADSARIHLNVVTSDRKDFNWTKKRSIFKQKNQRKQEEIVMEIKAVTLNLLESLDVGAGKLPVGFREFMKTFTGNVKDPLQRFLPKGLLSGFELGRLKFDYKGLVLNMDKPRAQMLYSFFVIARTLIARILMNDRDPKHPTYYNRKVISSLILHMLVSTYESLPPHESGTYLIPVTSLFYLLLQKGRKQPFSQEVLSAKDGLSHMLMKKEELEQLLVDQVWVAACSKRISSMAAGIHACIHSKKK